MNKLIFSQTAWEDYLYWQNQDKKTLKKINSLIKDISRDPFGGIEKPEALKQNLSGYYSRRIDDKNRLVYIVYEDENKIEIYQCKGHYE